MAIDLNDIFGYSAAPAPEVPSPEPAAPTAQPQAAGPDLDHGAQPEPIDFGPDGWPVGSIEPEPCPTCPGLLTWQDVGGRWRCERCDGKALARSQRWADSAARARQRWPGKSTPRAAPGRGPAALADPQHLDSRRLSEAAPGGFVGLES